MNNAQMVLIKLADYLDGIGLYRYANKIDAIITKIAYDDSYGWWIDPNGTAYSVDKFGHKDFIINNIDKFSSTLTRNDLWKFGLIQLYTLAFDKGWIRVVKQGSPFVNFEVPDSSKKYIETSKKFLQGLRGVRRVFYNTVDGLYFPNIPIEHFMLSDSVSWLKELEQHAL